jgi:hypothetical protein
LALIGFVDLFFVLDLGDAAASSAAAAAAAAAAVDIDIDAGLTL